VSTSWGSWICFQSAIVTRLRRSFVMTLPRAQECYHTHGLMQFG